MTGKAKDTLTDSTKFNREWTKIYPFIVSVKGDVYKFFCTPACQRKIACDHQGKRDIERHVGKNLHQSNVKAMKSQSTIQLHTESSALAEKVSPLRFLFSVKVFNLLELLDQV